MNRLGRLWISWMVVIGFAATEVWSAFAQSGGEALVLTLDGPLTPAFKLYLERSLTRAKRDNAALVILQLRTPGGQISLMEDMVEVIRNSPIPVIVFVAPRGANAWSAGTVITLAGHASAMAPETSIGAASPVGGQGEDLGSTLESKVKEALKAKVRVLAARRSPEAIAFAESTIDSAKAATSEEAYQVGLVDFLAVDVPDLLKQLDGFNVEMAGEPRTLHTRDLAVTELPMNLLETVLNLLNDMAGLPANFRSLTRAFALEVGLTAS